MFFTWEGFFQDKEGQVSGLAPVSPPSQVTLITAASPLETWEGAVWETMCQGIGWMKLLVPSPYSQPLPFTKQPKGTRCDSAAHVQHTKYWKGE